MTVLQVLAGILAALMICAAATGLWLLVTKQPAPDAAEVEPEPASLPG